jgi:hypothetical protein
MSRRSGSQGGRCLCRRLCRPDCCGSWSRSWAVSWVVRGCRLFKRGGRDVGGRKYRDGLTGGVESLLSST